MSDLLLHDWPKNFGVEYVSLLWSIMMGRHRQGLQIWQSLLVAFLQLMKYQEMYNIKKCKSLYSYIWWTKPWLFIFWMKNYKWAYQRDLANVLEHLFLWLFSCCTGHKFFQSIVISWGNKSSWSDFSGKVSGFKTVFNVLYQLFVSVNLCLVCCLDVDFKGNR